MKGPSSEIDDQQIISHAKDGNVEALSVLLNRHRDRLHSWIAKIIPDSLLGDVDADDIFQETCFAAFRRIGSCTCTDSNSFWSWLATISRNCVIDRLRAEHAAKRGGGRIEQIKNSSGSTICLLEELAVYHRTPSQSAAKNELIVAIESALNKLQEDFRTALRLRYIDQLPATDVAMKMGRSEAAIYMLCMRGMKALQLEMKSATLFL